MSLVQARTGRYPRPALRTLGFATLAVALVTSLAGCGDDAAASDTGSVTTNGTTKVTVAAFTGTPYTETTIEVPTQADIRAKLPKKILDSGELVIGHGALPAGFPPLDFVGNDQKTLTGSEPDLGRLVAAVFGLKPVQANATWDNLFVGIDTVAMMLVSPTSPIPRSARRSTTSPRTGRTTWRSRSTRTAPGTSTASTRTWPARPSPWGPGQTRRRSCWSGRRSWRPRARSWT